MSAQAALPTKSPVLMPAFGKLTSDEQTGRNESTALIGSPLRDARRYTTLLTYSRNLRSREMSKGEPFCVNPRVVSSSNEFPAMSGQPGQTGSVDNPIHHDVRPAGHSNLVCAVNAESSVT
jgi:hypothetical protein